MIRKTYRPIQIILDNICRKRYQRLMMSYALKIHRCTGSRNEALK